MAYFAASVDPPDVNKKFAESLELMGFLTTLLGSEHVERFIPYAAPVEQAPPAKEAPPAAAAPRPAPPRAANTVGRSQAGRPAAAASKPAKADKPPKPDKLTALVIEDAARLLSWGREWPHVAGLIARLADRPPEPRVWEILRTYRSVIEAKARRVPD